MAKRARIVSNSTVQRIRSRKHSGTTCPARTRRAGASSVNRLVSGLSNLSRHIICDSHQKPTYLAGQLVPADATALTVLCRRTRQQRTTSVQPWLPRWLQSHVRGTERALLRRQACPRHRRPQRQRGLITKLVPDRLENLCAAEPARLGNGVRIRPQPVQRRAPAR